MSKSEIIMIRLTSLLFIWLHCALLVAVHGSKQTLHGNHSLIKEVDILHLLNISGLEKGVSRTDGPIPAIPAWRLYSGLNHVQVSFDNVKEFKNHLGDAMSSYFVFKPNRKGVATLLSIHLPGKMSPLLRMTANFRTNRFILSYSIPVNSKENSRSVKTDVLTTEKTFSLNNANVRHLKFSLPPGSLQGWAWVAMTITPKTAVLYVNCREPMKTVLHKSPNLKFPPDALVYFRQEPGLKHKFVGSVQVAKLYSGSLQKRPWECDSTGRPTWSDV